ncbi:MAG: hypothetical protein GF307_13010, partial [candidate division Zixibacteria bacterium]|nr:hypothetical protein [candidate division Zixibacteria bacterium]
MKMTILCVMIVLSLIFIPNNVFANDKNVKYGSIHGRIIDGETQWPIEGATVLVAGAERGAASDSSGEFTIDNIPVGTYNVNIYRIGYKPLTKTDIIVRSQRIS